MHVSNDSCFMNLKLFMWWIMWDGTMDWVHESSLTSYFLGRKVEKGKILFLAFSFKIRKGESMWSLWMSLICWNKSLKRSIILSWVTWTSPFHMWLNKMKCMLVMYMEEKKEGEMEEELRVHKSISLSFSFIKISSCLCYYKAIKPSSL